MGAPSSVNGSVSSSDTLIGVMQQIGGTWRGVARSTQGILFESTYPMAFKSNTQKMERITSPRSLLSVKISKKLDTKKSCLR